MAINPLDPIVTESIQILLVDEAPMLVLIFAERDPEDGTPPRQAWVRLTPQQQKQLVRMLVDEKYDR